MIKCSSQLFDIMTSEGHVGRQSIGERDKSNRRGKVLSQGGRAGRKKTSSEKRGI